MTIYLILLGVTFLIGIFSWSYLGKFAVREGKDERGKIIEGSALRIVYGFILTVLPFILVVNLFIPFSNFQYTIILTIFTGMIPFIYLLSIIGVKKNY